MNNFQPVKAQCASCLFAGPAPFVTQMPSGKIGRRHDRRVPFGRAERHRSTPETQNLFTWQWHQL